MSGDLFLANVVSEKVETVDYLLSQWIELYPESLISNLTSAVPYDDSTAINQVLNRLINTWIKEAAEEEWYVHDTKLKLLIKIIRFAPEASLNLLYIYLDLYKKTEDRYSRLSLDNYGPLVGILGTMRQFNIEALRFIRKAVELKLEHTYQNYSPSELVRGLVRPTRIPSTLIEDIFGEITASLQGEIPDECSLSIAVAAASEVLAGAHEFSHSTPSGISLGAKCVSASPMMNKLRDQGLLVYEVLLSKRGCLNRALDIAEDIGKTPFAWSSNDFPLLPRITKDRQRVLGRLLQLNLGELDIPSLSRLEDILAHWWLTETEGTELAIDLLRKINRRPLYLFIRHCIPSNYQIYDFEELLHEAPQSDRWEWWCAKGVDLPWSYDEGDFVDIVEMLSSSYKTREQLKDFFSESSVLLDKTNASYNPPIIKMWINREPQLFVDFVITYGKESIPHRYKSQLISSLVKY
ncbi:MAG: hypothetical protein HYZ51_03370 [Candidatus Doudnabacteria bacterium]|nr:hypothetical protein [Candidatus Doudnabacteria bacterium]